MKVIGLAVDEKGEALVDPRGYVFQVEMTPKGKMTFRRRRVRIPARQARAAAEAELACMGCPCFRPGCRDCALDGLTEMEA